MSNQVVMARGQPPRPTIQTGFHLRGEDGAVALGPRSNDAGARVRVTVFAHAGSVLRLAHTDPLHVREDRPGVGLET